MRYRFTSDQLHFFSIRHYFKHLWLIIPFSPFSVFNILKGSFDSLDSGLGFVAFFFFRDRRPNILLEEYVSGIFGVAIGLEILYSFQSEFDHFCDYEKFLKDGGLFSILGEDEELCDELKGPEIL